MFAGPNIYASISFAIFHQMSLDTFSQKLLRVVLHFSSIWDGSEKNAFCLKARGIERTPFSTQACAELYIHSGY